MNSRYEIVTPEILKRQYSLTNNDTEFIQQSRETIRNILSGKDTRLMVIVGPCSIHEYSSALDYAHRLKKIQSQFNNLFIVMRVYLEKPRSRLGWKGFIYDPDLNNTYDINKGLIL